MDVLGVLHLGAAVGSLVSGGGVIMSRKGTRAHRRLGWTYVASMATLNVTALLIYDLFGGFGPFHDEAPAAPGALRLQPPSASATSRAIRGRSLMGRCRRCASRRRRGVSS